MYNEVIATLRAAYNERSANDRDQSPGTDWKVAERQHFLSQLQQEGKKTLLEVGAGTGRDSQFFQENGLQVTCTDLSPAMVNLCRQKGLDAHEMDFLSLDFPAASFDALYALNCLLHVPTQTLPDVLSKLQTFLKPGGLFYLGVYGGEDWEGIAPKDWHEPKRFFSYHSDEYMKNSLQQFFELTYFKHVMLESVDWHFQSFILRR
ncbi:MAG TPA: class I SAM-dependent methyltransferase [Ktedonobacteraceae bacterium]|jgi:SAM-dependent methyltransferase|nr:class I SAM-dependent methyltransferase [Ktedonobacteraceae bacterium]